MSRPRDTYDYDYPAYDTSRRSERAGDAGAYYQDRPASQAGGDPYLHSNRSASRVDARSVSRGDRGRYADDRGYAQDEREYEREADYPRDQAVERYGRAGSLRRRSSSRRRRGDDDDDYYSRTPSREGSRERGLERSVDKVRQKVEGHFGKDKKDLAATVIGALAGGFLAHEASGGKRPVNTIGGALLGGLAGNAIEHRHLKRTASRHEREDREDRERERERGYYS